MSSETEFGIEGIHLTLPFPVKVSPDVDRARARHLAWVKDWDLWYDRKTEFLYRQGDFPLFAAHVYPFYTGDDLDLVTDLVGWAWLWDDSIDRQCRFPWTEDVLRAYLNAVLDPASAPEGHVAIPLVQAWRSLNDRLRVQTSQTWQARHEYHWRATFKGYEEEARNNATETILTLGEYFDLRRLTSGPETTFDWIEGAGHFEAPPEIHATPEMLRLRRDAVDIIAMTNDMVSARNEWSEGNTDNVIIVLAYQHQCTWPEAARRAEQLTEDTVRHFSATEQKLHASPVYRGLDAAGRAATDRFVDGIKHWVGGSFAWHLACPRYKAPATRPIDVPAKPVEPA